MPSAFNAVLLAGALYVAWIGISVWRSDASFGAGAPSNTRSHWTTFRQAALTNLLNPKAHVFMLAIFPQFMRPEYGTIWVQAVVLGGIIVATQAGVYGMVALAAGRLCDGIARNPAAGEAVNRVAGLALILAAIATGIDDWRGGL